MRPFEIGDMGITKSFGAGTVLKKRIDEVVIRTSDDEIIFDLDGYFLVNEKEPNIKTIRKPRAGSKEARDIVAMLAKEYRKFPLIIENELEMEFCKGIYTAYKLSKEMLESKQ